MTRTAVVLFTRDLRVHDNPALHDAVRYADQVVPLFVADPGLPAHPRRTGFLADSLADLRESLRVRGGDLVVRRGDPVIEAVALARSTGADVITAAQDASGYAQRRERRLSAACAAERIALRLHPGITVVPPGALHPTGGDHYRIFTPYWRAWTAVPRRHQVPAPRRLTLPPGLAGGDPASVLDGRPSRAGMAPGGETAGRRRLVAYDPSRYADRHDDLAADATSRLSPYLHFGCVSAGAVLAAIPDEAYRRQLCWRDFYHQVLLAFPALTTTAYRRAATEEWAADPDALSAWQDGCTGIPIVDAGMRQLAAEGFIHNRARLITASYLTRELGVDWREGARWYARHLVDHDVANNFGNWQWVAGTGNDTRPHRRFNPLRQAERFDPGGDYVRRYVTELAGVPGKAVHRPWLLPEAVFRSTGYRMPLRPPGMRAR